MVPIVENPFTFVYFPTALALGALHALEPGHAKTLTAAYLIGIKGTKRDAFLLGLSVAATHSFVVVGLSIAALWLGREAFTQDVAHWLQIGSGAFVIALGLWMLLRRLRQGHPDHSHMADDDHARAHAESMPDYAKRGERPTISQIIAFGAAGGMVPCPASVTVMLLALSIGKFASGALAVIGFSVGLAVTLVGIGLVVVAGLNRLGESSRFHWLSSRAPVLSAVVVVLSGVAALIFAH